MSQFRPESINIGEPEEAGAPQAQADLELSIDHAIERAISTEDWPTCRGELIEVDSAQEYEGYSFALATTAYYVDHDPLTALRLAHAALNRPLSRWRPDTYRLLAIVLEECSQPRQARDALKLGLMAVDDLAIPEDEKAQYRQYLAETLSPDLPPGSEERSGTGVGRDSRGETKDDVDSRLESALATGDWEPWQQHRDRKSAGQAKTHYEGEFFGLASAAYYAEHNTNLAEKLVRSALAAKESRWRPDSYRLLGEILQRRGKLEAAETALDAAIDTVRKFPLREDEKEAYVQSIDEALLPIRVQLLEEDRSGVKSVLRNGIITGERTDKRECRETLIALKNFERSWFPDFISALLYTLQSSSHRSNARSPFRAFVSMFSMAGRLLRVCLKITIAASVLIAAAYLIAKFTPLGCQQTDTNPGYCGGALGAAIRSFATNLASVWGVFTAHPSAAEIVRRSEYGVSLAILTVILIIALAKLGKAFIAMISTRYFIRDGRITIRTGLFRRVRKNYEIIHASRFIIDQGIIQTLLRRARLSFYTISVGGQSPEEVVIIGRHKFILNLDRDIRGVNRMMRSIARLKGIVSVD